MPHEDVGAEGEDGDEDRSGGPEIDAPCIQVFTPPQTGQLSTSQGLDLLFKMLLPRIELDHSDTKQYLIHHLNREIKAWMRIFICKLSD